MNIKQVIEQTEALYRSGKFDEAEASAKSIVDATSPEDHETHGRFFDFMCQCAFLQAKDDARIQRVQSYCELEEKDAGQRFWTRLHLGAVSQYKGEVDQAEEFWAQARALPHGSNHRGYGAYSTRSRSWLDKAISEQEANKTPITWHNEPVFPKSGPVHLVSCNDKYLNDWLEIYVGSLSLVNPGAVVHVHVVRPSTESIRLVDELRSSIPTITINLSSEDPEVLSTFKRSETNKAYFASARFLCLPEIMDTYQTDVVVTDIDIQFAGPANTLLQELPAISVGMRFAELQAYFPWTWIGANFLFLRNTEEARGFAAAVQAYCYKLFREADPKEPLWYIDQNALAHAFRMSRSNGHGDKFVDINKHGLGRFFMASRTTKEDFRQALLAAMNKQG